MDNSLIKRQAAIDAVNSHFGFSVEEEYGSAVQEVLNDLPSVQPEQKKGKWIVSKSDTGKLKTKCSVCGATYSNYLRLIMNFCPNCGCQMKGDEL